MRTERSVGCLLVLGALALACGGGDEAPKPSGAPMARTEAAPHAERAENQAPVVERVVIHPPKPLPGNTLEARIEASDPDGDPIRLSLEWRVQGRVVSSGPQTSIAPDGLHKGDDIELRVTASDGRDESEPVRATATVGNQAPTIQALYLTPDGEVKPGQEVTAAPQGVDADGDRLEYEFQWWLNGRVVKGADQATFDTTKLVRGDRLQAKVRVTDGEEWSPVAESMVLQLANRPPKLAGVPALESEPGGGVHGELKAEDPDGDKSLRFRVVEGPPGLSIDPVSGRMSWKPAPGTTGHLPVEVAVADSFGAESSLRFELTVAPETEAKDDTAARRGPHGRKAEAAPPAKAKSADDEEESDE